jgi:hydroxyacylglutathione hydrolase
LISYDSPYYLIVDPHMADELFRDLGAIGLDNCGGYFETPAIRAWASTGQELQCYNSAFPSQVAERLRKGDVTLVDVRSRAEWNEGHIPGAQHIMLGYLKDSLSDIPVNKPILLQCRIGVRSAIGASILQASGFSEVMNLMGGIRDWEAAGFAITRD